MRDGGSEVKIIVDIDNVLVDWQEAWIHLYQRTFNRRVPWSERGKWECYKTGTHFFDYTAFSAWLERTDFWMDLNANWPTGGADVIADIRNYGHDILLATHRPKGAAEEAAQSLATSLDVPIVFASPLEKAQLDGDVWIDDSPELMWELKRLGKEGWRFVCPWNEGAPGIPMGGWDELIVSTKRIEVGS